MCLDQKSVAEMIRLIQVVILRMLESSCTQEENFRSFEVKIWINTVKNPYGSFWWSVKKLLSP